MIQGTPFLDHDAKVEKLREWSAKRDQARARAREELLRAHRLLLEWKAAERTKIYLAACIAGAPASELDVPDQRARRTMQIAAAAQARRM